MSNGNSKNPPVSQVILTYLEGPPPRLDIHFTNGSWQKTLDMVVSALPEIRRKENAERQKLIIKAGPDALEKLSGGLPH